MSDKPKYNGPPILFVIIVLILLFSFVVVLDTLAWIFVPW